MPPLHIIHAMMYTHPFMIILVIAAAHHYRLFALLQSARSRKIKAGTSRT